MPKLWGCFQGRDQSLELPPILLHVRLHILGANGSSLSATHTFVCSNALKEKPRLCSSHAGSHLAPHMKTKVLALFIDEKMKALTDPVLWDQD